MLTFGGNRKTHEQTMTYTNLAGKG